MNFFMILSLLYPCFIFRRERDNSEAERLQHINQIRELQEHIQEKDRLLMELQEQVRCICSQTRNTDYSSFLRSVVFLTLA